MQTARPINTRFLLLLLVTLAAVFISCGLMDRFSRNVDHKVTPIFNRLMVRWFVIGFLVRVTLAVLITLLMVVNWEAGMWYLVDLPTLFLFEVTESLSPSVAKHLIGNDPFYMSMNIFGALIWGLLFMLAALRWIKNCGKRLVIS
jgi:hypothetical protein